MKELAIAEPGVSTRAADAAATALKRGRGTRDFFVLKTTVASANRTLQRRELDVSQFGKPRLGTRYLGTRSSDHPSSSREGGVLALQRNGFGVREPESTRLQIVPFPHGTVSLVNLALDPTAHPEDMSDCFNFLVPRATFDTDVRRSTRKRFVPQIVPPWRDLYAE